MVAVLDRVCANGKATLGMVIVGACVLAFIGAALWDCADWLVSSWRYHCGRARRREEAKSQRYCDRCCTQRYTTVIQRAETYPVLGEPTTITANVCVCRTCGTDLFDMELDEANLTRAYIQAGCVQTEAGRWTKPEASECEFPSPTE